MLPFGTKCCHVFLLVFANQAKPLEKYFTVTALRYSSLKKIPGLQVVGTKNMGREFIVKEKIRNNA